MFYYTPLFLVNYIMQDIYLFIEEMINFIINIEAISFFGIVTRSKKAMSIKQMTIAFLCVSSYLLLIIALP